jgi:hypothetical protein
VAASFYEPVSSSPKPATEVYETFRERVLPYPTGNIHPRFWGWVMGTGTPREMLAEIRASSASASGILVSGARWRASSG